VYVKSVEALEMVKYLLAAVAALSLAAPIAAQAQDAPSYAQQVDPSYTNGGDENIHGRIVDFDGGYNLEVRDDRGFIDNVQLHDGTIINPTGLDLAPGMVVSILGYNAGGFFAANEIDTPYTFEGDVPYYAGHPWDFYGPSISLGFFFGSGGWWHSHFYGNGYSGFRDYHPIVREYQAPVAREYHPAVPYRDGFNAGTYRGSGHTYGAPAQPHGYAGNGANAGRSGNRGGNSSHGDDHGSGHQR
jgi:hypothetical protein